MGDESREVSWPELPLEIYELIASKLPLSNILRWKAVCHSCYDAITYMVEKSSLFTWLAEPPRLLLYPDKDLDLPDDFHVDDQGFVLYNLNSGRFSKLKNSTIPKDSVFLGLSQGWVLFLSNKLEFVLLNPMLSGVQLPLPPLSAFPDIQSVTYDHDRPIVKWSRPAVTFTSLERFRESFPTNVVVCPRWSCSNRRRSKDLFGVVVMYLVERQTVPEGPYNLAFCNIDGGLKWTKLDEQRVYNDITWHQNHLYGYRTDWRSYSTVTVWSFDNAAVPIKMTDIQADTMLSLSDDGDLWIDGRVIKTLDDLFLIWESDVSTFCALKLDCSNGRSGWIEVESIGNYALLLDQRQSMLNSGHDPSRWDENSVYSVVQTLTPDGHPSEFLGFNLKERVKEEYNDLPYTWERLKEKSGMTSAWKKSWPVFLG